MATRIKPKTPLPRKGQSSEDYWRERETRQRAANIHDEARFAARINDIFQSTQDSIQQEIESFYQRYADKEGIDIAEARRRVSKIDMEKYERLAAQYVKAAHEGGREAAFSDIANEQMRLYNATMRINRLEMLKARCGIRAMEGYRLADQLINEALEERAYSEYYQLSGILGNTVQFNENMVRSIVNASYQNATWSQRLWNNQALLSERIGAQIAQGILTGKGSDVLARNIQKLTGQSTYVCQRLMRTELRRVQTAAAEQSMLDNGVTEYKFLVANGINPCDECLALDGKVFKISEMSVGKNAPPKHPLCHCCTCPALDEEKWQRWLDGPAQAGVPWAEYNAGTEEVSNNLNNDNKDSTPLYRSANNEVLNDYNGRNDLIKLEDFRKKYDKIIFDDRLVGWDIDDLRRQMDRAHYNDNIDEELRLQDLIRQVESGAIKAYNQQILEEFLTGVDDMLTRFPQIYEEGWLKSIRFNETEKDALAFTYPGKPNIYIHKRLAYKSNRDKARVAGYHETVHIVENMIGLLGNDEANEIVNEAFRRLGIRKKKDKDKKRIETAGYSESKKSLEIIAYSLEKNYANNSTSFSQEIEKIIVERMRKK